MDPLFVCLLSALSCGVQETAHTACVMVCHAKKTISHSQTEVTHHVSVLFTTELRPFPVQLPGTNNMESSPGRLWLGPDTKL